MALLSSTGCALPAPGVLTRRHYQRAQVTLAPERAARLVGARAGRSDGWRRGVPRRAGRSAVPSHSGSTAGSKRGGGCVQRLHRVVDRGDVSRANSQYTSATADGVVASCRRPGDTTERETESELLPRRPRAHSRSQTCKSRKEPRGRESWRYQFHRQSGVAMLRHPRSISHRRA